MPPAIELETPRVRGKAAKVQRRVVRRDQEKSRKRRPGELPAASRGLTEAEARRLFVPPHFIQRFRERVPSKVDPITVGRGVAWAISNQRTDMFEFLGRTVPSHRRRYRFQTADGHFFVALVDTDIMVPITVLTESD